MLVIRIGIYVDIIRSVCMFICPVVPPRTSHSHTIHSHLGDLECILMSEILIIPVIEIGNYSPPFQWCYRQLDLLCQSG